MLSVAGRSGKPSVLLPHGSATCDSVLEPQRDLGAESDETVA